MNPSKGLLPTVPRLLSLQACILIAASDRPGASGAFLLPPTRATSDRHHHDDYDHHDRGPDAATGAVEGGPGGSLALRGRLRHQGLLLRQHGGRHPHQLQAGRPRRGHLGRDQAADGRLRAMLDINDIFLYTPNTVGTAGTYIGQHGRPQRQRGGQQPAGNPTSANKVSAAWPRPTSPPATTLRASAVSGRPRNIDAVGFSRGPNASVFGLGNGFSGTLNQVGAKRQPPPATSPTSASAPTATRSGYRTSLDVNRALTSNLAVRVSGALPASTASTGSPRGSTRSATTR